MRLRPFSFARIGGEEFAVLMAGADIEGAMRVSERLRVAVADTTLLLDGNEISWFALSEK